MNEGESFSQEWGLYCEKEPKVSLISSVYFIGSLFGLLTSTAIFDQFGRKKGSLGGAVISLICVGISAIAPNYEALLLLRIVNGFSQIINYTGTYCWVLEMTPKSSRNLVSSTLRLNWSVSYFSLIGISYFLPYWRHTYAALAVINAICVIPLAVLPESPRFQLVRGMGEEAKKTLETLSRVTGNPLSFNRINLIYEVRVQNFLAQMKDFKEYNVMLKETLIAMYSWFGIAILSYCYSFGWNNIGYDMYTSYTLAATAQAIVFVASVPICNILGRKNTVIFFLLGTILCNLVSMINLYFSEEWSLALIASVVGSMNAHGVFAMMYLFVIERAPTSHCGMILSLGSGSARLGSFVAPQINLLYGVTSRRVPLGIYVGLALLSLAGIWTLPDTTGKCIPATPKEVRGFARGQESAKIDVIDEDTVFKNLETSDNEKL